MDQRDADNYLKETLQETEAFFLCQVKRQLTVAGIQKNLDWLSNTLYLGFIVSFLPIAGCELTRVVEHAQPLPAEYPLLTYSTSLRAPSQDISERLYFRQR